MCRSIKTLRREGETATDDEIAAAALQFVRKLSGYRQPSRANAEAFDRAVEDVAKVSRRMLDSLAPAGMRGDMGQSTASRASRQSGRRGA